MFGPNTAGTVVALPPSNTGGARRSPTTIGTATTTSATATATTTTAVQAQQNGSFTITGAVGASNAENPTVRTEQEQQEEGVLRDVLDELDRERSKRAELEAMIRKLNDECAQSKAQVEQHENVIQLKQKEQQEEREKWELEKRQLHQRQQQLEKASKQRIGQDEQHQRQQHSKGKERYHSDQQQHGVGDETVSRREYIAMKVQVEGYQQLVQAVTSSRPAIIAAAAADQASMLIPIHVLRLLEVMPWDPVAQEYIFGIECIYEWQIYDTREKKWQNQIKYFPTFFKSLPVVKSKGGLSPRHQIIRDNMIEHEDGGGGSNQQQLQQLQQNSQNTADRSLLMFLAGATAGAGGVIDKNQNHGILTDERLTKMYSIKDGIPLPYPPEKEGTWEWIGGWRVIKNSSKTIQNMKEEGSVQQQPQQPSNGAASSAQGSTSTVATLKGNDTASNHSMAGCCDENGWSYAREAQHFLLDTDDLVYNSPYDDIHGDGNWKGSGDATGATTALSNGGKETPTMMAVIRKIRRRKWTRRRILVDYPYASERTRQYLKLLANNARLTVTVNKVSDQLVEMKTHLTETEEMLSTTRTELLSKNAVLDAATIKISQLEQQLLQQQQSQGQQQQPQQQQQQEKDPQPLLEKTSIVPGDASNEISSSTTVTTTTPIATTSTTPMEGLGLQLGEAAYGVPLQSLFAVAANAKAVANKEQVKELGSKISLWVQSARKQSEDSSTSTALSVAAPSASAAAAAMNNAASHNQGPQDGKSTTDKKHTTAEPPTKQEESKFDWSRIGNISFASKKVSIASIPENNNAESDSKDENTAAETNSDAAVVNEER